MRLFVSWVSTDRAPMRVGNIPQFYLGLLVNQVSSEKLIVDAYYEHSYEKALQAFTLNRLVGDAKKARKVLDALIEAKQGNVAGVKVIVKCFVSCSFE